MADRIIDRGRGPELEGTRITVYRVFDYDRAGLSAEQIAGELSLTVEDVETLRAYIEDHRAGVEAAYGAIQRRISLGNPPEVEAGSARSWEELRKRITTRLRKVGASHARGGR